MATEAKRLANRRYEKYNAKRVSVVFYPDDFKYYEYLRTFESMGGHLKELLRKDYTQTHTAQHDVQEA